MPGNSVTKKKEKKMKVIMNCEVATDNWWGDLCLALVSSGLEND